MAAYAALLSLMHTINQIQNHPRPPISLHQKQVDSLLDYVTLLQDFLERYGSEEDNDLESRIIGAAYAAEDVIESHIVDRIHAGSNISAVDFCQGLERVIRDVDLIKKDVMEIIKEKIMGAQYHDQLHRNSSVSTASGKPASTGQISIMVVFDDVLINEVLDKLTGQQCDLQIIPIVGMGGIGKTTLARNIYSNPLIVQHFDILAWVTISQEYTRREIFFQALRQETKGSKNNLSQMSEDELGEILFQHLYGRRYLIVMDDIWSIEAWDRVKPFFPDNNNGSRIMITTRLSNLAFELSSSHVFQMKFLDEDKGWDLLREIVFGKLDCPSEFENIGKEIVRNCRGLPLSIVVIGGLLTKANITRGYWEYILENLSSIINLENDEHCLQILRTSYKALPIHLKACILYMAIFPEDHEIHVSELIKLWVAEGILRPVDDKGFEEVAEEYVKELIDRNLILVHKLRWNGEPKLCKIHDILRDLCLREAQKQRFICVLKKPNLNIPQVINVERRVCIHDYTEEEYSPQFLHALESASLTRSLILMLGCREPSPSLSFRLLRVYATIHEHGSFFGSLASIEAIFQKANLRYLSLNIFYALSRFTSLCSLLWNLQMLKVVIPFSWEPIIAPSEIWEMPLLRHAILSGLQLPDPPSGEDNFVLQNLQTLSGIKNFTCSDEVIKRIPNIKTLKLDYSRATLDDVGLHNVCLDNLDHLQKLETFNLDMGNTGITDIVGHNLVQNLTFPHSLMKLSLRGTMLSWKELTTRIGSLPLLQVLRLDFLSCIGPQWETADGKFCNLRFLLIYGCFDLKCWETDSAHFPRLEQLLLGKLQELEEISLSIGDIPTLKLIQLVGCSKSVEESAKRIKEEQEDNGNEGLQVLIRKI